MKYKQSWKVYNDYHNTIDFAKAKAEAIAREEERKISEQKLHEQAVESEQKLQQQAVASEQKLHEQAVASEQKLHEQAVLFAVDLIRNTNWSNEQIVASTRLSVQEVVELRKKYA